MNMPDLLSLAAKKSEMFSGTETPSIEECLVLLGIITGRPETYPFAANDITAGSETELQVAVKGKKDKVDLPFTIEKSNYFAIIIRRAKAGDASGSVVTELEKYLNENSEDVWENSWVRFPLHRLSRYARMIFDSDLKSDKADPSSGYRSDFNSFFFENNGETFVRMPVSYLLKIALADSISHFPEKNFLFRLTGERLLGHFLSDNTSPETHSFHVCKLNRETGNGLSLAKETSRRFLLSQLIVSYSNIKFDLKKNGQEAMLFFSPHPPVRQEFLNQCISDNYYRDLFMSPCLSGWDRGQEKKDYMGLCHRVLSMSQLNAIKKLRDAGIITNNMVVLPGTSNTSLANNGTHVSLGSRKLLSLLSDTSSGFGAKHEKYLSDLVIKVAEHFLPLFVGSYSAAPYRMSFEELRPEKALGFLPHELDYTHLRMMWRRWMKKSRNKIFGQSIVPLGPNSIDSALSDFFNFKGDFIPDFRLIDYLACLMSSEQSSPLSGVLGNEKAFKRDLDELGIFDERMSLYLLLKGREYSKMGFSGFEGRFFSLFESFRDDMANAVNLQTLLLALAYRYIASGLCTHESIPHTPFAESERRQIFFGAAIGIPTFYVRNNTDNFFLKLIISRVKNTRQSKRYPGYTRVKRQEYYLALIEMIREDGSDIIEMLGMNDMLEDLYNRIVNPAEFSAAAKLTKGILKQANVKSPLDLSGEEFNKQSEKYYREGLRDKHISEALEFVAEDVKNIGDRKIREKINGITADMDFDKFIAQTKEELLSGSPGIKQVMKMIQIILALETGDNI